MTAGIRLRDTSGKSSWEQCSSSGVGCSNLRLPLRLKSEAVRLQENASSSIFLPQPFLLQYLAIQGLVCGISTTWELVRNAESQAPSQHPESEPAFDQDCSK